MELEKKNLVKYIKNVSEGIICVMAFWACLGIIEGREERILPYIVL